jgi:hypothetical protein
MNGNKFYGNKLHYRRVYVGMMQWGFGMRTHDIGHVQGSGDVWHRDGVNERP